MKLFFVVLALCVLPGCTTMGLAPRENRSFTTVVTDAAIKVAVWDKWRASPHPLYSQLELLVHGGRVLILGCVENAAQQIEAVRLVWSVKGVQEVIDEMAIGRSKNVGEFAQDAFITAQIKSALTFREGVQSLSYDYKTYGGVVYLIGIAETFDELQTVLTIAREIKGVHEVVNHVRLKEAGGAFGSADNVGNPGAGSFMPAPGEIRQADF